MVSRPLRVAVVGGLGHAPTGDYHQTRYYGSPRDRGRGELVRLEQALRAGGIDRVVIRTRWNSHSATTRIRRVCRALGIPCELTSISGAGDGASVAAVAMARAIK